MYGLRPSALVVDDERVNLLILEKLLRGMGVDVTGASNGRECLTLCESNRYDYVFLDQRMPGLTGTDTMTNLKQIFSACGISTPIICVTGLNGKEDRIRLLAEGFTDYLAKPVDKKHLEQILAKYTPVGKTIISVEDEDELDDLPNWIGDLREVDATHGIRHCGSASEFLTILGIFRNSIEEKSMRIEELFKESNWEDLGILVHSLKSTSRAVGALEISDVCMILETACNQGNIPLLNGLTPKLLAKYRDLGRHIQELSGRADDKSDLKDITYEELKEANSSIRELIDSYDYGSIEIIMESLEEYNIPHEWRVYFDGLNRHFNRMNWEGARSLMNEFGELHLSDNE